MARKNFKQSSGPAPWLAPEPDSDAKRAANRERVAGGKTAKSSKVSKDPRIADSKRSRWKSQRRAKKAASENRELKRSE